MGRVLRLSKIIAFLDSDEDIKASLMISKMVLFLIIYIHCLACLWWQLNKADMIWMPVIDMNTDDRHSIYSKGFTSQYIYSLHASMQLLMGVDVQPRDSVTTIVAGLGVFMGCVINANIFGELAMIL